VEIMCYGIRRAEACVDESDHHALLVELLDAVNGDTKGVEIRTYNVS
jgi:hypothetical protein